ncbi:MAG: arginine--tRNA ligase [Candidatus Omnitrophota bacterium]
MRITQIQKDLRLAVEAALEEISKQIPPKNLPQRLKIELEIPKDYSHGDLTANVALRLAKNFSTSPIKLAGAIKDELRKSAGRGRLASAIDKIEASPPGFLNFWFSRQCLYGMLSGILKAKGDFGRNPSRKGVSVNIEFVSANPTGPLTVAHGRQAAVGDALGRILEFSGHNVFREYFINDVGIQVDLLGKSIHSRYLAINGSAAKFPEDGYHGEYIKEIADQLSKKYGKRFIKAKDTDLRLIAEFGVECILRAIKDDLEQFGVSFDKWFSQKKLLQKDVRDTLNKLKGKGYIYEKDGATWFKSTSFGDDKDRVVVKSDGAFTYLAPDIAYHLNKYRRKFRRLIDIWGPDHHGYMPRLRASVLALGYPADSISLLIVQLATLYRGGVALSMSTRKGEFITLKEVMDEVGCDVTKFFFLMRKLDSHLDFDLEVAKKNSLDNPVYYIQYAHARIASILNFSDKLKNRLGKVRLNADLLSQPEELLILRLLNQFPFVVETSAGTLEPYRVVDYLNELAKIFHNFYTKHRVVLDSDLALTKARLALVKGIKVVLANGLGLLGISLPERM